MNIVDKNIDGGNAFDWGRTSEDYAKYRDVYPKEVYQKVLSYGLCTEGQRVLDLGTGTGVLPRNMYKHGARFIGTDISENQIGCARRLSAQGGMDIEYTVSSAEELDFPENSFDAVTAFTCFFYFDHERLMPRLVKMLKPEGHIIICYLSWLPYEDRIAAESERLILKYNPKWTGAGFTRRKVGIPKCYNEAFEVVHNEYFDVQIPFTIESWNGRIKACRGVGASLSDEQVAQFEKEHTAMLKSYGSESFTILHTVALADLKLKK